MYDDKRFIKNKKYTLEELLDSPKIKVKKTKNAEPQPDLGYCSVCGRWFKLSKLIQEWENDGSDCGGRYYLIDTCPKCKDGGCIEEYTYSVKQQRKYMKWCKKEAK